MNANTKFPSIREAAKMGPLSEYCLRLMLANGQLPGVYSGKKFLVNYERLLEQLKLKALDKLLLEYDGIAHERKSNGSGGGKHHFYYADAPQYEEVERVEFDPFLPT